jgi:hypothetical protein
LDRYKYPKKTNFGFFSSISWGLFTDTKCEKVVLFGFSTGNKGEFRIFEEQKFNFSPLIPVLNTKSSTFSSLGPVQSPQEIEEKNSKKVFFGYLYRSKDFIFGPKKFLKNFLAGFGTWYCLQKKFKKLR